MQKEIIIQLNKRFEEASYHQKGVEYWMARDIQNLLDYEEWRNFLKVIEKAKQACLNSKQNILDHFVDVNKMVKLGSGSEREVDDIMLTRYACYLIAQNGDPRKEKIAFAQSYFAIQTRKQELLEERIALVERLNARNKLAKTEMELSGIIYERGVDAQGFARIRSKGDQALFGGYTTFDMKKKLKVPDKRALADFLPTITIKAKDLASEITNFNVKKSDLQGESPIASEHVKNNKDVRNLLAKSGIRPEELSSEEDIKKLERRIKLPKKHKLNAQGFQVSKLQEIIKPPKKLDAVGFEASGTTVGKISFSESDKSKHQEIMEMLDEVHPTDPEYFLKLLKTRMPFGKYKGRVLMDLPETYLCWFERKGFPEGSLGDMLRGVHVIKLNGLEGLVEPIRRTLK